VVGISPGLNLEEHITKYHSPTRGYDAIVYTGSGLMGREVENIRSCDAVIFCGGRSGTLGEFAIAYDEGKVIGILRGTGGITDHIETIVQMTGKKTKSVLIPHYDPEALLDAVEKVYRDQLLPHYKKVLEGHDPDGVLDM
jgi:predicted Rossmann-fold nucleotide-binding protein